MLNICIEKLKVECLQGLALLKTTLIVICEVKIGISPIKRRALDGWVEILKLI